MWYNGESHIDRQKAIDQLKKFFQKGKIFELSERRRNRTYSQNNYLHLLISWYALSYGETAAYIKEEVFKKVVNPDVFLGEYANRKTGEIREEWRSTSNLSTKEMTLCIDRFRDYSAKEFGLYLPAPSDLVHLKEIEIQVNNNKEYL